MRSVPFGATSSMADCYRQIQRERLTAATLLITVFDPQSVGSFQSRTQRHSYLAFGSESLAWWWWPSLETLARSPVCVVSNVCRAAPRVVLHDNLPQRYVRPQLLFLGVPWYSTHASAPDGTASVLSGKLHTAGTRGFVHWQPSGTGAMPAMKSAEKLDFIGTCCWWRVGIRTENRCDLCPLPSSVKAIASVIFATNALLRSSARPSRIAARMVSATGWNPRFGARTGAALWRNTSYFAALAATRGRGPEDQSFNCHLHC